MRAEPNTKPLDDGGWRFSVPSSLKNRTKLGILILLPRTLLGLQTVSGNDQPHTDCCVTMAEIGVVQLVEETSTDNGLEDDGAILTALHNTTKSMTTSASTKFRQDYESRLLSFQASTYYAKPACLSPLVCARFGWCNADKDMLCCSTCNAAVAVTLPSGLSAKAMEIICSAYREQLSSAHLHHCPFRLEARQFFHSERMGKAKLTVPAAFASVLKQQTVKLLEHPWPSQLLSKGIREIEDTLPSESSSWELPRLDVADEILSFSLSGIDGTTITAVDAVSEVADFLGIKSHDILLAAILGWTPVKAKADIDLESQNIVSLGCPLCLAMMEIPLKSSEDSSGESGSRPPKRQKRLARYDNPHDAHRHYCPFRCGFPTNMLTVDTPLWQVLLSRLISEREAKEEKQCSGYTSPEKLLDPEQTVSRIRKILMSGIVPKKVELDIDEEFGDNIS